MIRKLIYLIATLFLIVPNAMAFMGPAVAGGGMPPAAGAECSDCSGMERLYVHFENYADITDDTDLPCGCTDGTTTALSLSGSPEISGTQFKDGDESMYISGASEYYYMVGNQSTNYIANMSDDEVEFWVYITGYVNFARIFEIEGNSAPAQNYIRIYMTADATSDCAGGNCMIIVAKAEGQNAVPSDIALTTNIATANPSASGWVRITYGWDVTKGDANEHYLGIDTDDDGNDDFGSDQDNLTIWTEADYTDYTIKFGDSQAFAATFYIDKFHVKGEAVTGGWGDL